MGHSYREQVTAEHDAFCIAASLTSALENRADSGDFTVSLEQALEDAYGYLAEGLQHCRCMFAGLQGEAKLDYLNQFSDDSVAAMTQGGYRNDSTGELMQITWEEYLQFHAYRTERYRNMEATYIANEIAGDQNSYSAIVASDTEPQPSYSLQINGKKSEHATWVNKWGIAYGVARELQANNIDPDMNTGFIAAVLATADSGDTASTSGLEFSVIFESN